MRKTFTRDELHEHELRMVEEAFAQHQITKRSEGRWLLRRPDSGSYWAEVICLAGAQLFVGGDISPVVFGYADTSGEDRVRWLGGTSDILYYVAQKASIGMGSDALTKQYDVDVAGADLRALAKEYEDHEFREGRGIPDCPVQAALDDLALCCPDGPERLHEQLREELEPLRADWLLDDRGYLGMVLAPRVYYAWGALARLTKLLDEEKKGA